MSIKATLTRLEAKLGGQSTKHYLWVRGVYGESKHEAIDRHLQERGITLNDVGCIWLWGDDFCETIDYKNYSRQEDLIGFHEARRDFQDWLDSINGKSLGPPSEREEF
jgi:hypothetical protein